MKKLNKNIISCCSSLVYWLLLCWFWYFVPLYSLPIEERLIHKFFFCTICVSYTWYYLGKFFFEWKLKLSNFLFKEIYSKFFVNKFDHLSQYCLHILNITVKNYNLAPVTVSMETKLFKSEYGLCILKIQNSRGWRNIFCI